MMVKLRNINSKQHMITMLRTHIHVKIVIEFNDIKSNEQNGW